jgi:hypothetical protein
VLVARASSGLELSFEHWIACYIPRFLQAKGYSGKNIHGPVPRMISEYALAHDLDFLFRLCTKVPSKLQMESASTTVKDVASGVVSRSVRKH